MKKSIFIIILILALLSCGVFCYADEPVVIDSSEETEETTEVTPTPTPTATPEETVASTEELLTAASPTPTTSLYPVITKDPTNESVYTGDRAVFIARADNAETITWYLVSPDGSTTMLASSVPQLFSGISVSGTDSEKLVLTGVNTKISGYKAYARFGNENGFADSATATVTVSASTNPSTSPTPTASPKPSASPSPTVAPTATPTMAPVVTPSATATVEVTPRPTTEVSETSSRGVRVGFGMVLLLIICVAVIVGAGIILAMYVKGTIDLSWLENKVNGMLQPKEKTSRKEKHELSSNDKNQDRVEEIKEEESLDVDVPQKFYDIDDYKK